MEVLKFAVGPLDNNSYLVFDKVSGEAVVVDPGYESTPLLNEARSRGLEIVAVLNTHAHFDHVIENAFFTRETGAPLVMHAADLPLYKGLSEQSRWFGVPTPEAIAVGRLLADSDRVAIGSAELLVAHTPGHSPGGVCFLGDGFAIVGDTLFAGSVGRTDLPGGDMNTLVQSIRTRLMTLLDETIVYPGHGPTTTIGEERRNNPFF